MYKQNKTLRFINNKQHSSAAKCGWSMQIKNRQDAVSDVFTQGDKVLNEAYLHVSALMY